MNKERFEVFGKIIKDNEDIPSLLNNYQATLRLNELNDKVKELEQDLEFTTKTANELIEIKHKLEQELNSKNMLCENYNCGLNKKIKQLQQKLAELKEKAIVPKFSSGQIVYFANIVEGTVNKFNYIGEDKYNYVVEDKTGEVFIRMKERTFATEQEAQEKLKEMKGNE